MLGLSEIFLDATRPKSLPEKKRTELQDVSQDVGRDGEQAMDSAGC
jgi:hypothetical protein